MCLKLATQTTIDSRHGIKGFNLCIKDGKYKLVLPYHHKPDTPDLLVFEEYKSEPKQILDMYGNTYTTGWHAYKSTHDCITNAEYIEYLTKYSDILMSVTLRGIIAFGYQNDLPCYVGANMRIGVHVHVPEKIDVYDYDEYLHVNIGAESKRHKIDFKKFKQDIKCV